MLGKVQILIILWLRSLTAADGVTDAGYKVSKRRSDSTAASVYIHDGEQVQRAASCSLKVRDISPNRHQKSLPFVGHRNAQPLRGESRDNKRKIGIGIIRTRNIPSFIGKPGITSGRFASNAVSASRTTRSTGTKTNSGPVSG